MNDIAVIHVSGNGGFAVIDVGDYELAAQKQWHLDKDGYVLSSDKVRTELGGWLVKTPKGLTTDHKNRVKMDNRRINLRAATPTEQNFNQPKRKCKCSSKYKGVTYIREGKKHWQAAIHINKKKTYLGMFPTEGQAAMCYNDAAYRNYGDFAFLNIIEQEPAPAGVEMKGN